ncbi:hypothetical protein Dsin_006347 [Dipteronia sinensis]|uniref:GST N-terminal domain-containing protein n=1 Tax=Dipteronia sinensis TaxID=43782 RepID=A0AAE0AZF2_9ROSI|nr:hypothetical protein Dsin_006347 [Dipteronia sinensis]
MKDMEELSKNDIKHLEELSENDIKQELSENDIKQELSDNDISGFLFVFAFIDLNNHIYDLFSFDSAQENLPPPLDSKSKQPPPLFDGTTRLYTSYSCPFAQRVWITRNYKGLQDKIKLVPLKIQDRPAWYKEKDLAKREFAEELFIHIDTFTKDVYTSFNGDPRKEAGPAFDYLEKALHKFDYGPFFLGQFSLELHKIDAYKPTKTDPKQLVELFKNRFLV